MTVVLAAAMTYALHLISFPAGWSTPSPARAPSIGTRPTDAAMGSNGTVAVILANKSTYSVGASGPMLVENPAQRLLIVRADGTTTILNSPVGSVTLPDFPTYRDCSYDARNCAAFTRIVVAADGTPFVTFSDHFSGAFSGIREAALVWNGSWHVLQKQKVLHGLAKPRDPDNLSIAAADTPDDYAFTGNYHDSFANEDLNDAARAPFYMADVSGVSFYWGSVGLGLGDATAIRGPFVAGFDGGIKLVGPPPEGLPALALLWRCVQSALAVHPCAKTVLGPGVAYGVDSRGEVVGDDEPQFAGDSSALHAVGRPVLWRGRGDRALVRPIRGGLRDCRSRYHCRDVPRYEGPRRSFRADQRVYRRRARATAARGSARSARPKSRKPSRLSGVRRSR